MTTNRYQKYGTKRQQQPNRPNWDREHQFFRVRGRYWSEAATEASDAEENADIGASWEAYIVQLPSPIVLNGNITQIIDCGDVRIYPPFPNERKEEIGNWATGALLPIGKKEVYGSMEFPDEMVRGVTADVNLGEGKYAYFVRIDSNGNVNWDSYLAAFLAHCREQCKQWWIGSSNNPFDMGVRASIDLNEDFLPRSYGGKPTREVRGTSWFGAAAFQTPNGFEHVLTEEMWANIKKNLENAFPVDQVIKYFLDAVDSHMAFNDYEVILDLAIMYEAGENIVRKLRHLKAKKLSHIQKEPQVAGKEINEIFHKIIIDRNHIAHGRRPLNFEEDPSVLIDYLEAGYDFVKVYNRIISKSHYFDVLKIQGTL